MVVLVVTSCHEHQARLPLGYTAKHIFDNKNISSVARIRTHDLLITRQALCRETTTTATTVKSLGKK